MSPFRQNATVGRSGKDLALAFASTALLRGMMPRRASLSFSKSISERRRRSLYQAAQAGENGSRVRGRCQP
jgi:hypothetical protein